MLLRLAREFHINKLCVALAASMYQRLYAEFACLKTVPSGINGNLVRLVLNFGLDQVVQDNGTFGFVLPPVGNAGLHALGFYIICLHIAVKTLHMPTNSPRMRQRYGLRQMFYAMGFEQMDPAAVMDIELFLLGTLKWNVMSIHAHASSCTSCKRMLIDSPSSVLHT